MRFAINDAKDASGMLEYFNWFHDACIQGVVVTSRGKFSIPPNPMDTADFAPNGYLVRIDFAHHNYKTAKRVPRIIRATFSNCQGVAFDLCSPKGSSNIRSIEGVELAPAPSQNISGGNGVELFISWNVAMLDRSWQQVRNKILCFEQSVWKEIPAPTS